MKPELEQLSIEDSNQSFQFFRREVEQFTPFWHYHPELELTLISKGNGTRFIGDSIASFKDLDLVLVGGNLPHHWVSFPTEDIEIQEAYVFQFPKDLFSGFKECSHFMDLFDGASKGLYFSNPSYELLNQIYTFKDYNSVEQLSRFIGLIQSLCEEAYVPLASENYSQRIRNKKIGHKISLVTNYILENLHKKLTVEHMAEFSHLVPTSFCRWFRQHSGHSFVSFLNQNRVHRACQLLKNSSQSVQEIAFNCGFESISHFNRTFKQLKGCSPRVYRKDRN